MSKILKVLGMACLLWTGCKPAVKKEIARMMGDQQGGVVALLETDKARMQCVYLPVRWEALEGREVKTEGADEAEIDFRLRITPLPTGSPLPPSASLSFGLDSLFALVMDGDTLPAVFAERMPQGNIRGIEYLVGFERQQWKGAQAYLIFRDHLFTGRPQAFSFDVLQAAKIDSLSKRL